MIVDRFAVCLRICRRGRRFIDGVGFRLCPLAVIGFCVFLSTGTTHSLFARILGPGAALTHGGGGVDKG
jgi:hypothetical protein